MSEMIPGSIPATALGLYVHVPFCAHKCDFCAFYQTKPSAEGFQNYLDGIEKESRLVDWNRPPDTIFWGGGTPGILPPKAIRQLGAIMHALAPDGVEEWSVEMAPASVSEARLEALKEIGVTRISMGVQSFRPELLDALGRQHTREQVFRAYERIRSAGFVNVNLDLMFALPGQDESEWLADIDQAVALDPEHLSTYCLTFEEDTALWVKLSKGQVKIDRDREARLYLKTWERLAEKGYVQYEVANFAKPGHRCLHNLNTWRMHEWVGLGPSAASQYAGFRGTNIADLRQWHEKLARGERATEDRVRLSQALLREDSLIFGLRMNEGIDLSELAARFPHEPDAPLIAEVAQLVGNDLATLENNRLQLTPRGRLLADAIGADLLGALAGKHPPAVF